MVIVSGEFDGDEGEGDCQDDGVVVEDEDHNGEVDSWEAAVHAGEQFDGQLVDGNKGVVVGIAWAECGVMVLEWLGQMVNYNRGLGRSFRSYLGWKEWFSIYLFDSIPWHTHL